MKKTKIVCTMGPSSNTAEQMASLIEAGMNVARFNFSHGSHEEHKARFDALKEAREATGKLCAILLDTKGPEIRTHDIENNELLLERGHCIRISMTQVLGNAERFSVTYPELINDVAAGNHVLLDDGLIDLLITEVDYEKGELVTEVQNSGVLKSKKGVNVPNVSIHLPGITAKDAEDIRFGCAEGIDFIAASFVRTAKDVQEIRDILVEVGRPNVKIIAKIENQEGVDNLDEILAISDGIMVARGDLGVEIPAYEVPIVQKHIIQKCNQAGKPVITATQMLDSMQRNPRPTRAEAGDVANAIFDGTDAVMLSGETAAGDFPLQAVQTMAAICVRSEEAVRGQDRFKLKLSDASELTEAICRAVGHTAKNMGIKTIVTPTSSGYTALKVSKYRPDADIVAATFDEEVRRSLALAWGVQPVIIGKPANTDEMLEQANQVVIDNGFAKEGDLILITAGVPVGQTGTTNMMKIQRIEA